jgi:enoyl-CoA hydratase
VVTVTVDRAGGVAVVMVDNPPVNALDDPTLIGLREAADALGAEPGVRAVILTGAGNRAFIAGADLWSLRHALGPDGARTELEHHVSLTGAAFAAWGGLAQPAIAAVSANALGGGLEFALCCDLIIADPRARFGLPEVTLGLMPGGGGTQRLRQRVGAPAALELVLLGQVIDAHHAHELGLVNLVTDEGGALAQAHALAERLAALPVVALQSAKRALRDGIEIGLVEGLARERQLFLEVARSFDAEEGASAFLEKRAPSFEHR